MKKNIIIVVLALVVLTISAFFVLKEGQIIESSGSGTQEEHTVVTLTYKHRRWVYDRKNYEIDSDIHSVKQDLSARIMPTHEKRAELCKKVKAMGFTYKNAVEYAFFNIDKVVMSAKKEIDLAAKDAVIDFQPSRYPMFSIAPECAGFEVELETLYKELFEALINSARVSIKLNPRILHSEVTAERLRNVANLRSRFSTNYSQSSESRKHNVRLALKKFNGFRVNAGDTVSFNSIVGPRSVRNGFQVAKIIKNGQYEDGVGGGVCQSSTTLYNALLLADLQIKKAGQHSLPVGYVEPSFDAMVNSSSSDLIFTNTGEYPVFIRTTWDDDNVTAEVYGTSLPYVIKRRSVTTGVISSGDKHIVDITGKYSDRVKYKGDKVRISYAKDGLTSSGYLDYYQDGKLLESKLIRKNKYAPQQGLVVEGNKTRPPQPEQDISNNFFDNLKKVFGN